MKSQQKIHHSIFQKELNVLQFVIILYESCILFCLCIACIELPCLLNLVIISTIYLIMKKPKLALNH